MGFQNGSFMSAVGGFTAAPSSTGSVTLGGNGISAATLYDSSIWEKRQEYQSASDAYDIAFQAQDSVVNDLVDNFKTYIELGQEDKAMEAYNQLIEEMGSQSRYAQLVGENGNDKQLRSVARSIIESSLGENANLVDYIKDNTKSNRGVESQKIMWGAEHCDTTSMEDLLSETCGVEVDKENLGVFGTIGSYIAAPFTRFGQWLFGTGKKH